MTEQLKLWEPITNAEGIYYLYRLCEDNNGLELILVQEKNRSKKIRMLFEHPVHAYTSTNETLVFGAISMRYGSLLDEGGSFFTIENSDLVKKLTGQSCAVPSSVILRHFLFITSDVVTEIVSNSEPKVNWITYDLPQASRNDDDE